MQRSTGIVSLAMHPQVRQIIVTLKSAIFVYPSSCRESAEFHTDLLPNDVIPAPRHSCTSTQHVGSASSANGVEVTRPTTITIASGRSISVPSTSAQATSRITFYERR